MEEINNNIDPDKIHLDYIEKVRVSLDEYENLMKTTSSITTYVAHTGGYNLEESKYLFGLHIVFSNSEISEKLECEFRYNFHYTIDNLQEMYDLNEDGIPIFKKIFVATLAGISYSTLRGIIFEKTSKSNVGVLTIPVINPSTILDSWIKKE